MSTPQTVKPFFDPDDLKKFVTTIEKVSAYLGKSGAAKWWEAWIKDASRHTISQGTEDLTDKYIDVHVYIYMDNVSSCMFVPNYADTWRLFKLPVAFPKTTTTIGRNTADDSDMSGIEMESPHKEMATAHDFPCNISEVGEVRSLWIGHKGVCDIVQMRAQELAESKIQTKSSELKELATECFRAFKTAGLSNSKSARQLNCA